MFLLLASTSRCRAVSPSPSRSRFLFCLALSIPSLVSFSLHLSLPPSTAQPNSPLVRAGRVHAPKIDVVEADDLVFFIGEQEESNRSASATGVDSSPSRAKPFFPSSVCTSQKNLTLNLSDFGLWRTNELAPTRPLSSGADETALALATAEASPPWVSTTPILFLFSFLALALVLAVSLAVGRHVRGVCDRLTRVAAREERSEREREGCCETVFALSGEEEEEDSDSKSLSPHSPPRNNKKLFRWPAAANERRRGPARRSSRAPLLHSRPAARGLTARCALIRLVALKM